MLSLHKRLQLNYWSIALAAALWCAMFRPEVQRAFNFWSMMPVATGLLATLAFIVNPPLTKSREWNARNIFLGIGAAAVLYGVFWAGNQFMNVVASALPGVVPHKAADLQSVYNQGSSVSRSTIAMLLMPIGACEEIFWRGMVQRIAEERYGRKHAVLFNIFFYTIVHISTLNVMLILAAFACGVFWGLLYYYTRSVVPGIISHALWDPFIFAVAPIG